MHDSADCGYKFCVSRSLLNGLIARYSQSSVSYARLRIPYSSQFDLAPVSLLIPNASVARKYHSSPSIYESAKTEIFSLLGPIPAVARKYFSSTTACAPPLAPNASIPRDCLSTPSSYERPDGNIITVGPILVPALLSTAFLLQVVLTICLTNGEFACFVEVDNVHAGGRRARLLLSLQTICSLLEVRQFDEEIKLTSSEGFER